MSEFLADVGIVLIGVLIGVALQMAWFINKEIRRRR